MCAFEFGPGPVVWMYMSEIMTDKGVGIAVLLNWFFTCVWAIATPFLFDGLNGYSFVLFGAFSAIYVVIIALFMKETKGLSAAQVHVLYRPEGLAEVERVRTSIPEDED